MKYKYYMRECDTLQKENAGDEQNTIQVDGPLKKQEKLLGAARDKLFLTLCILMTARCATGSLDVISILFTVFLWIIYSNGRKGKVEVSNLRFISGTLYALYVMGYVSSGIYGVLGILVGVLGIISPDLLAGTGFLLGYYKEINYGTVVWVMIIFFIIAVLDFLITYFVYGKAHRLAKSVYKCVESEEESDIEELDGSTRTVFFVYGILTGVLAIVGIVVAIILYRDFEMICTGLSEGFSAASFIISVLLLEKHILSKAAE